MTKTVYHSLRHPPHTQSRISREQASKRKSGKFFEGFDVSPEGSSAKVTYCERIVLILAGKWSANKEDGAISGSLREALVENLEKLARIAGFRSRA